MRNSTAAREKPLSPLARRNPPALPVLTIVHADELANEEPRACPPEKPSDPSGLVDPIEVASEHHAGPSHTFRDLVRGLVLFVVVGGTSFAMWSALVRAVATLVTHLQAN